MNTKRTAERKLLPASLAEYKPGKAIGRRLRDWLAEIPEDTCLHGITPERSLELRLSLILSLAYAAYCMPGGYGKKPPLSPREIAELGRLYNAVFSRPLRSADTIALALSPLNDNEATYWSLLQASAQVALYAEARTKGAVRTAEKARDKAVKFQSILKTVQHEEPKWSVRAWIEETMKRMKTLHRITVGRSAAYGYYARRKEKSKG